jgi:flagellar biosynthetic protein FliR
VIFDFQFLNQPSTIYHLPSNLLGFALVLTRISAFFVILPVFGWKTIPLQIKVAATVLLSVFFYVVTPLPASLAHVTTLMAVLLLCVEAIYGLALGLIIALLFSVVQLSGQIIEQQMGLTMSEIVDPLTETETNPFASLVEMIFVLLFLSANGHHLFLLALSRSYDAFPPGTMPTIPLLAGGVVNTSTAMFVASLRLAAPMLAAFLVLMVTLALLARLVPEMDILFLSMPVRAAMGLFLTAVFLPFINSFVTEMADWMTKLLPL